MRSNNFSKHGYQDDSAGECLYERMAPYMHWMYYSIPFGIGFLGQQFKSNYRLEIYKFSKSNQVCKPFKKGFCAKGFDLIAQYVTLLVYYFLS